jgi:hypothetical protein
MNEIKYFLPRSITVHNEKTSKAGNAIAEYDIPNHNFQI